MRAVIQRADDAFVTIDERSVGAIEHGLVVLLGITHDDSQADASYLVNKIVNLRIFEDSEGKMNHSLKDIGGEILSISQFTLYGSTKKGRRPSFIEAAPPDQAKNLYETFNEMIQNEGIQVSTGEFGEMMHVRLTNVGPVTLILDSKDK